MVNSEYENKILGIFLYNNLQKFNEIEKKIKIRSNKLVYHMKKLLEKGILIKEGEYYSLSEASEYLIPYLSDKKSILSILLIHLGDEKNIFLYRREKRPFKGLFSLPGGRILVGENINSAVERIMKKYNIKAKLKKVHSVSLEYVKKGDKIVHSFVLIFVSAVSKECVELMNVNKNKKKIISSDYFLIKNHLGKNVEIQEIVSTV